MRRHLQCPGLTPVVVRGQRFPSYENEEGDLEWLIRKDNCTASRAPAQAPVARRHRAIRQRHRRLQLEHCIGCGYCVAGCPFNIPRISKKDNKACKCALCSDRVYHGLEPACVKSCPTGSIQFGTRSRCSTGAHRVEKLKERGFENAGIYDPAGVGGTHVVYVLQHADKPEIYSGLPKDPHISPTVELWKGVTKPIMSAVLGVSVLAGFFHYMTKRPKEEPEDDPEAENAAVDREQDLRDEERRP